MKIRKFESLLRYSPVDILSLILLSILLHISDCQIHCLSSNKILQTLRNRTAKRPSSFRLRKDFPLEKIVRLLEIADRNLPGGPLCLRRVIVFTWLLRWFGQTPVLKIGVCREDNSLLAHTWLELNNKVLESDSAQSAFHPLLTTQA